MSTEYVVLIRTHDDGHETDWREMRRLSARSARSAISQALGEEEQSFNHSAFVAVPARSWKPVTVKVETKTQLRFSL